MLRTCSTYIRQLATRATRHHTYQVGTGRLQGALCCTCGKLPRAVQYCRMERTFYPVVVSRSGPCFPEPCFTNAHLITGPDTVHRGGEQAAHRTNNYVVMGSCQDWRRPGEQ